MRTFMVLASLALCGAAPEPAVKSVPEQPIIDVVNQAVADLQSAPNVLAQGAARPKRSNALCALVKPANGNVVGWVGTLVETGSSDDGQSGAITVRISDRIMLRTAYNKAEDGDQATMFKFTTDLFKAVAKMSIPQKVRFSGTFFQSAKDCMFETSTTIAESIRNPDFLFKFSSIEPID